MSAHDPLLFGFLALVPAMLALDLGLFQRGGRSPGLREALLWTLLWIALALGFNAVVAFYAGRTKALEFLTGYLIEYSLSVDNVFVFALIFGRFAVRKEWQRKVLFWGVLGAIGMRFAMIFAGAALIARFHWVLYLFGIFLIFTGVRMLWEKTKEASSHPENNALLRLLRRVAPFTETFEGGRFWVRREGKLFATPLLAVLVCVEAADLVFALDSIPAIFGVTLDPFIVFTSNVFAILGLRSLYFVLAHALPFLRFLKPGLALVLAFVGVKMLLGQTAWAIGTLPALLVVAAILSATAWASLLFPARRQEE